jgi:alpha-beta hydrolase superfamily lysophospholipase
MLAGCAAAPGPAGGPFAAPAPAAPSPAGRAAASPGPEAPAAAPETLALLIWPARGPTRAALLALHGFGDAGELAFEDAAAYWAGRGIAVYAPDQRGFGANPSRRNWPGPAALEADAVALAREVRARNPGVPLVVLGHSMGGGVALAAAAGGLDADALVLVGPAIAGGDALNPALRAGAWALAAALPERRWTGRGLVSIQPTDNPEALRRTIADPRHFSDPSSRELWGLVEVMDRAAAAAPRVAVPTLTLMGARDEVLRPERVRAVHETVPGRAGYRLYPEGWHWLLRDRQAEAVWRDVADFVLATDPARP